MDAYSNSYLHAKTASKAVKATRDESKNVRQISVLLRYVADATIERSHRLRAKKVRPNKKPSNK